jgi:hypothetical protein
MNILQIHIFQITVLFMILFQNTNSPLLYGLYETHSSQIERKSQYYVARD